MHLSFWELDSWFSNVDYTIVGSGIVGLNAAIRLREAYPEAKILVLERGPLPQGASTRNAGFACFGSISEIVSDLNHHTQDEVISLIEKRRRGLDMLRGRLGDKTIGFRNYGGYELFFEGDPSFGRCAAELERVNEMLRPLFRDDVFRIVDDSFGFAGIHRQLVYNPFEGQIDTGRMMQALLREAVAGGILILNGQEVVSHDDLAEGVEVHLRTMSFKTRKLLFAVNGFGSALTKGEVVPARAQVLITEPIENLHIKGTFHIEEGYYYFRNIGNRILFGGARNLDFEGETTMEFGHTDIVQNRLEEILNNVILPGRKVGIYHRWSGIMGMGPQKTPVVRPVSDHVFCGVRLGGMGVAIGSIIGKELAELAL